jgi:hypothetical protein
MDVTENLQTLEQARLFRRKRSDPREGVDPNSKIPLQSLQHRVPFVYRYTSLLFKTTVILALHQNLVAARGLEAGLGRPMVA